MAQGKPNVLTVLCESIRTLLENAEYSTGSAPRIEIPPALLEELSEKLDAAREIAYAPVKVDPSIVPTFFNDPSRVEIILAELRHELHHSQWEILESLVEAVRRQERE